MTTLEDKILGEKAHVYCSSSEDEAEEELDGDSNGIQNNSTSLRDPPSMPDPYKWQGSSTNTGPKGVMEDWRRFRQLEIERREEQDQERLALIQKLSLTCRSALDDEKEKENEEDPELAELLIDPFLEEYQKQRMQEMLKQVAALPKFGKLIKLDTSQAFLDAIDKEHPAVTVIVHLYEDDKMACRAMNGCLVSLSKSYPQVKFCRLEASTAGVSAVFQAGGVPALLVYKKGQLIGNFIRVSDELGDDFFAGDVERFLREHGILPDTTCVPPCVKPSLLNDSEESDENSD